MRRIPGLILALAVFWASSFISVWLGAQILSIQGISPEGRSSPVSAILVAILFGMILVNAFHLPNLFSPGLEIASKKLLRLGIVLVGIKLSFLEVLKLGALGVPVVVVTIALAILFTLWLSKRLELSSRLGALAAASTAICGVTATVSVAAAIDAEEKEVAYTIANVTLFGVLAMLAYPFLAHAVFGGESASAGLFLGSSIHETAQVVGAALSYKEMYQDQAAFDVATVTKLTRNLCLVAVVPILGYVYARQQGRAAKEVKVSKLFPLFVLGFIGMALIRTIGESGVQGGAGKAFGLWDSGAWKIIVSTTGDGAATWLLGTAMASVGLSTKFSSFRGLGLKPVYVGAASALFVGAVAFLLASWFGPMLQYGK